MKKLSRSGLGWKQPGKIPKNGKHGKSSDTRKSYTSGRVQGISWNVNFSALLKTWTLNFTRKFLTSASLKQNWHMWSMLRNRWLGNGNFYRTILVYTAPAPMKVLRRLVPKRVIDHPPQSPDLNIVEDLWAYLARKVGEEIPKTFRNWRPFCGVNGLICLLQLSAHQ